MNSLAKSNAQKWFLEAFSTMTAEGPTQSLELGSVQGCLVARMNCKSL